jgi:hypothetical protein
MPTTLAFRTPIGGVSIRAGQVTNVGSVDVSPFHQIRVVVGARPDSTGPIVFQLLQTLPGGESVGDLDVLTVQPSEGVTRFYPTPGVQLTFLANASGASGNPTVDVVVFGSAS